MPEFKGYICYRAAEKPITVDGMLDEPSWASADWTDDFQDIRGGDSLKPLYRTRVKMLWDHHYFYIAAELEEPHLWATYQEPESIIFHENDFEIFIDPDGDTHNYFEIEVNALGTVWDLMLVKPYRDRGPALSDWTIRDLKHKTSLKGTLNNPNDVDQNWTLEMAIPWRSIMQGVRGKKKLVPGDQWRINFSRVQWSLVIDGQNYIKEKDGAGNLLPESNWVWVAQGKVNMHMPEMWGMVQFSQKSVFEKGESLLVKPEEKVKWQLRKLYYQMIKLQEEQGSYQSIPMPSGYSLDYGPEQYLVTWRAPEGGHWHIDHTGRVWYHL